MNEVIKNYLVEDHLHRSHLLIVKQHRVTPLFATKLGRKTMINKTKLMLIATIAASSAALPAAALAQSAYTTGTAASRAAAGYPSPYGSVLYDDAPGHFTATPYRDHDPGPVVRSGDFAQVQIAYDGHDFSRTLDPLNNDTPLACGKGRVRDPQSNLCRGPADISADASLARYAPKMSSLPSEPA
jgi:hypothetical protein